MLPIKSLSQTGLVLAQNTKICISIRLRYTKSELPIILKLFYYFKINAHAGHYLLK